ncbi:MAG: hypothetical protein LBE08_11030, partial [Bifidobacteriaceae bacterium]|nr:hypothetical protein [Bifidobacteriaceae bacterium]
MKHSRPQADELVRPASPSQPQTDELTRWTSPSRPQADESTRPTSPSRPQPRRVFQFISFPVASVSIYLLPNQAQCADL